MRTQRSRHPGLVMAISSAGSITELARRIQLSVQAVSQWEVVPAERCKAVEYATGVSRTMLRPDIYGEDISISGKFQKQRPVSAA
jgi:DNA-binding transcriptional regulator YdaS (Cro superfamily)